jgi:hypothetical protein
MGQGETYNYDLRNVAFSFLGFVLDGGFGEGGAMKIEFEGDDYIVKKGVDGSCTYCATNDSLYKVTITLGQQAPANTVFARIRAAGRLSRNGVGIGTLNIADLGGSALLMSPVARLTKPPTVEFAAESKDREWIIMAPQGEFFPGGSFSVAPAF